MKVTVLLKNDHEALQNLFERFAKSPGVKTPESRKDLFNQIRREILIHSQMEQEIFYPAMKAIPSARAAELAGAAEEQHAVIERLLHEMNAMHGSDKNFDAKMSSLIDEVTRHIELEEEQIFDEARKNLTEYRLEELGLEMEDRRKILVTIAA